MGRLQIILATVLLGCVYSTVSADIYSWEDENGVRHFTNYAPPVQAQVIMKTEELPYDEQADAERMEMERQERRAAALQEIAEKEARLAEMQQAAEQRIEAANRKAEEALQQAESLLDEAENNYNRYSSGGYGYYPYYTHYKINHYNRWYYRKNGSIYYKKPHHKYRYKHRYTYGGGHWKYQHRKPSLTGRSHIQRTGIKIRGHFNGHRSRSHPVRYGRF